MAICGAMSTANGGTTCSSMRFSPANRSLPDRKAMGRSTPILAVPKSSSKVARNRVGRNGAPNGTSASTRYRAASGSRSQWMSVAGAVAGRFSGVSQRYTAPGARAPVPHVDSAAAKPSKRIRSTVAAAPPWFATCASTVTDCPGVTTPSSAKTSSRRLWARTTARSYWASFCASRKSISKTASSDRPNVPSWSRRMRTAPRPASRVTRWASTAPRS